MSAETIAGTEDNNVMIDGDKSGDYGSAIRGDDLTAAFNRAGPVPTYSGGSEAIERLRLSENANRIAVAVGAAVIIALIFFCFRLAFNGMQNSSAAKALTGQQYLEDPGNDTAIAVGAPSTAQSGVTTPPAIRAVLAPRAAAVQAPPPMAPYQPPSVTRLAITAQGRADALAMLSDCRAAYTQSEQLSSKWLAWADASNTGTAQSTTPVPAPILDERGSAMPASASGRGISADEWRTIDTQMQAISTMVVFATRPTVYPDALQETSAGLGREMNTYLQTMRIALESEDPAERGQLVGRAETHRAKAGELLNRLETAIRSGSVPGTGDN